MIGGAPVSQAFADEIGADGYARDSTLAVVQGQGAAGRPGDRLMESARGWEVVERVRAGETLVFDGGYGTMLFAAGLLNGACPELWNDTHAEVVRGHPRGLLRRRQRHRRDQHLRRHPAQAERVRRSATARAN